MSGRTVLLLAILCLVLAFAIGIAIGYLGHPLSAMHARGEPASQSPPAETYFLERIPPPAPAQDFGPLQRRLLFRI